MKAIDQAIEISGGLSALAKSIGVSPQNVSNWRARGVPAERCPMVERATDGVIRCEDLRPDVDWSYLRGTDSQTKEAA